MRDENGELFVIEARQRKRGQKDAPWSPLPDAHTTPHDALKAMAERGTSNHRVVVYRRAGLVNGIRCEECELLVYGNDLPEGWSQYGKSRFLDAPSGLASHCPEHSDS